jgi:flagellar hook-associated protein 1 FlgK
MAGNILDIGRSGLFAAQVGLSTTGHNIANANVAGYSRQEVVQSSAAAQDYGYGFVGSGTEISQIKRYSDEFLNTQVRAAQASKSTLDAYQQQIEQVDNMLADSTSGLSPALQDFFKGVQDAASDPSSSASRQALLSTADSLASRFQQINGRLQEIRDGVNEQIDSNVTLINSYARQIADLNDKIGSFSDRQGVSPNDLLDQRDQLVADLNKLVKADVVAGDRNSVTVSIGTGNPLVVGKKSFELAAVHSPTDQTQLQVGYVTKDKVTILADSALSGGELGGLLQFRSETLDRVQNSLGRIAIGVAFSFNAQHKLGIDLNGQLGTNFFNQAPAFVGASSNNSTASTAQVGAVVADPSALSQSDYRLNFDGNNYTLTRVSDNKQTIIAFPQSGPQRVDGLDITISGTGVTGDSFLIKPTILGAAQFSVAVTDRNKIAAAAPIVTSTPLSNTGSGTIDAGAVNSAYPNSVLTGPVTLTYDSTTGTFSGFPPAAAIKVTVNGSTTTYPAGTPQVPFTAGAKVSFGGIDIVLAGTPANGDTFTIAPNVSGVGDNRNMRLLGDLQSKQVLDNNSSTFQGAYAEMISFVGNKARETQVNDKAADGLLTQATAAQQSVSGVNLDEEATNLLKYQQAYQAAGKVMQIASTMFDALLAIGAR